MAVPCCPRRPAPTLLRSLGPTGLLGLAWTAAPAVCGTALLASLGPVSEWLLYHRPLGLAALHRDLRARGRARASCRPTRSRSSGAGCSGWPRACPPPSSASPGGGLLGYQVARRGLERPRRGDHRGQPEGPRDPRSARRSGAVADPAGRRAPPAAAELALRPHQPRDGHDRRAAPGLPRRHVPRDAAAHRGGGRARRGRRRDGSGGHPGLRAPPGAVAPRGRRPGGDGRARGPRSDRPAGPQSRHDRRAAPKPGDGRERARGCLGAGRGPARGHGEAPDID